MEECVLIELMTSVVSVPQVTSGKRVTEPTETTDIINIISFLVIYWNTIQNESHLTWLVEHYYYGFAWACVKNYLPLHCITFMYQIFNNPASQRISHIASLDHPSLSGAGFDTQTDKKIVSHWQAIVTNIICTNVHPPLDSSLPAAWLLKLITYFWPGETFPYLN